MPVDENRLRRAVVTGLHIKDDRYRPDLKLGDLDEWDSLGHLDLVAQLESDTDTPKCSVLAHVTRGNRIPATRDESTRRVRRGPQHRRDFPGGAFKRRLYIGVLRAVTPRDSLNRRLRPTGQPNRPHIASRMRPHVAHGIDNLHAKHRRR